MLNQIAPVRSDVADRRALSPLFGLEAPREVGRLKQPVLQVRAVHEVRLTDLAVANHFTRLLHEWIAAVVESDRMYDAGFARGADERSRIFRIQRKRLVRHDVLSV